MARQTIIAPGALAVEGLDDIVSGLRRVQLQKAASEASQSVTKPLQEKARTKWASQDIRPSQARSAVGRTATQRAAGIVLRYSRHPYAAGVEFGSLAFRQFRPWRGNRFTVAPGSSTGYVIQDTIAENMDETEKMYADTLQDAIARAIDKGV
jgi:hypothetical protein